MARDIILDICDALVSIAAVSDIEEMCRYEVAKEMEYHDRLLDDAELEGIVRDVVEDEALADPIESIDGGIVSMTDIEWENTPEEYKVIDTDGEESAIIEGAIYKVSLREDTRIDTISQKISREIESVWNMRNASLGIDIDRQSYGKRMAGDAEAVCPDCGSYDQTAVWYDDDVCYWHCNQCGSEYEVGIGMADATIEEITVEDIPIYEDEGESVFGSVFYDGELGWTWQIWRNGECVEQQLADSAGEAYGIFNEVKREYEELAIGESLKDVDGGEPFEIEDIVGDDLVYGDSKVSRLRTAVDIVMGSTFVDDSELYGFDVEAGDCYRNLIGEEIEVLEADEHSVMYLANEMDEYTHDYRSAYYASNRNAFVGYLVEKGYLS